MSDNYCAPIEVTPDNATTVTAHGTDLIARCDRRGKIHATLTALGWRRIGREFGIYLDGVDADCVNVSRVSRVSRQSGAVVWDAFRRDGFVAGMRAARG